MVPSISSFLRSLQSLLDYYCNYTESINIMQNTPKDSSQLGLWAQPIADYFSPVFSRVLQQNQQLQYYFNLLGKVMHISLRNKNASLASLNSSDVMNSSADQSRQDSSLSKRFSRKNGFNQDSNRSSKTPKMIDNHLKQQVEAKKSGAVPSKKLNYVNSGFIRKEDMFIKLSRTPSKSSLYVPPISTDRATESTILYRDSADDANWLEKDIQTQKKRNLNDLEEELELRAGEIIMLEDENMKLKGQVNVIETEHLKFRLAQQKQRKETFERFNEKIDSLKNEVAEKNDQLKGLRKSEQTMIRELKGVKYDKMMVEKQLQQIYKRRLSKELRELMSFREVSLMHQVDELRSELEREKSEKELSMENQIGVLETKQNQKNKSLQNMQVYSSTLNKRIVDSEEELRLQTDQFSRCYTDMKDSNDNLVEQLRRTRKENLTMKRLNIISQQNKRKGNYMVSQESDTLSFSLSPRQDREV